MGWNESYGNHGTYCKLASVIDPECFSELSHPEMARYARHLSLPEVGTEGQQRLKAARVLCIGTGGLGSPAALYLAAAGVGRIGLVDADRVDLSNLQRQILHGTSDVGRSKLASARDRLAEVNPHVQIDLHEVAFRAENGMEIARDYDIVLDGTDNFPTRYLSNDVCAFLKKPNLYGSILRFEGQCSVFAPHLGGPCYRCMLPEPPAPGAVPGCAEGGVIGVLPGVIGTMQALEAIKLILGIGEPLVGRLVHFDALRFKFREFKLRKDPNCPVCGEHPSITTPIDYDRFCGLPPAQSKTTLSVTALQRKLGQPGFLLVDVREPLEWQMGHIAGSVHIPLGELKARMGELDPAREIGLLCKSGVRSARALGLLQEAGFQKLRNIEGGIIAWAREVDPSLTVV